LYKQKTQISDRQSYVSTRN